jgi:hypothetical protein
MTTVKSSSPTGQSIELSPSYNIPLTLIVFAIPLLLLQPWLSLVLALFGLFLMFQAIAIRLQFTETALDVYRSQNLIRRFPYNEWQTWRIFWNRIPILFYFKEVNSIHFLPIIFNAKSLKNCLEKYCPLLP